MQGKHQAKQNEERQGLVEKGQPWYPWCPLCRGPRRHQLPSRGLLPAPPPQPPQPLFHSHIRSACGLEGWLWLFGIPEPSVFKGSWAFLPEVLPYPTVSSPGEGGNTDVGMQSHLRRNCLCAGSELEKCAQVYPGSHV